MKQLRFKKGDLAKMPRATYDARCTVLYVFSEGDEFDYIVAEDCSPEGELIECHDSDLRVGDWEAEAIFGRFAVGDQVLFYDGDVPVVGEVTKLLGAWPEEYDAPCVEVSVRPRAVAVRAVAELERHAGV